MMMANPSMSPESRNDAPAEPNNGSVSSNSDFRISTNTAFSTRRQVVNQPDVYYDPYADISKRKSEHRSRKKKKSPQKPKKSSPGRRSRKKSLVDSPTSTLASLPYLPDLHDGSKHNLSQVLFALFDKNRWSDIHDTMTQLRRKASPCELRLTFTATNDEEETILHVAAWKAPPTLTLHILETVPDKNRKDYLLMCDKEGNTPLHLACANLDARADFIVIKNVLLLAPEALETNNFNGDTPLHLLMASDAFVQSTDFSVEVAAEEAITSLLNMVGPQNVLRQNFNGLTLLHIAVGNHAHERVLAQLLIMAPDVAQVRDKRGMLPLHYVAAAAGSKKIAWTFVRDLIEAFPESVMCQTNDGDTPLHLLMSNTGQNCAKEQVLDRNTTKLAEFLIGSTYPYENDEESMDSMDLSSSPLMVQNNEMLSPLHVCAMYNTPPQLTRRLMESPMAPVASALTTQFGTTALHLLCASRKVSESVPNIDALATPEACAVVDGSDRTALVVAVQNDRSSSSVIKALCNAFPEALTTATRSGFLPIHLAVQSRKVRPSIVKALVKKAPKTLTTPSRISGNLPLHEACRHGAPLEVVELLLKKYPKAIHKRNKLGELAVSLAVEPEVLRFLEGNLGTRRSVDVDDSTGSSSGLRSDSASV